MSELRKQVCRLLCLAGMALALIGNVAQAQGPRVDEIPAQIAAIDIEKQTLTLAALGRADADYTLAFGVTIKLIDGAIGTVANLAEGDGVTALVDNASGQILEIYVVSQQSAPGLPSIVQ